MRVATLEQTLRERLDSEGLEGAFAEGSALDAGEAVAWARRARGERKRPPGGWESLTPTELEVVRHAATGLTNPQIGEQMFITRGTVKVHLSHIYAKLGVRNRSELAAEAARRQLGTAEGAVMADSAPTAVVERFMDHLRTVSDNDAAVELLAVDVVYENSWLPTVRGRERVRKLFQALHQDRHRGRDARTHDFGRRTNRSRPSAPTSSSGAACESSSGFAGASMFTMGRSWCGASTTTLWPSSPRPCAACSARSCPRRARSRPPRAELLLSPRDPPSVHGTVSPHIPAYFGCCAV